MRGVRGVALDRAAVRAESLRIYHAAGFAGVRRWMAEAGVTLEDLRQAHSGDAEALRAIDCYLAADEETDEDFPTAVERYLEGVRGTPLYEVHRANLLNTTYHQRQLQYYERFARFAGSRVLDLGAGAGGMLVALADRGVALAVGLEVDPARHRLARIRTRGGSNITCVLSPDGRVRYPDGFFDIVICCHVVEHVEDPRALFREIARVLRPGGRAFVSCPNRLWPLEPHSGLPGVTYLPPRLTRRIAGAAVRSSLLPARLRSRFATVSQIRHFFSTLTLCRLIERSPFRVVIANPEDRFIAEHPRLARVLPAWPWARRRVARLGSWDLLIVAERPADA